MFLVSQLIWQDHVIKRSYNSMGEIHPANFSGHSDCNSGHMFLWLKSNFPHALA